MRTNRAVTGESADIVKNAEDPGCLVLSDAVLRADHALVKAIVAAGGRVLSLRKLYDSPPPWRPDPRQAELVLWAVRRAHELGLELTSEQALYVCVATGNDLFALDDQLELLRTRGVGDLKGTVQWTAGGSPWQLADHILAGELPRALSGLEALFLSGFQEKSGKRLLDPAGLSNLLIGALQRGARSALELASRSSAHEQGEGEGEGNTHEKAARARAKLRRTEEWRALFEDTAVLERAAKSGAGVDVNDFTRLALRWSRAGAPRAARQAVGPGAGQAGRSTRRPAP